MKVRVVTRLPVDEIWSEQGQISRRRIRDLSGQDIKQLLTLGSVRFVVADVGWPLMWVALEQRFNFWKDEVQLHLLDPVVIQYGVQSESFPGGYSYEASEWEWPDGSLVLLTKWH